MPLRWRTTPSRPLPAFLGPVPGGQGHTGTSSWEARASQSPRTRQTQPSVLPHTNCTSEPLHMGSSLPTTCPPTSQKREVHPWPPSCPKCPIEKIIMIPMRKVRHRERKQLARGPPILHLPLLSRMETGRYYLYPVCWVQKLRYTRRNGLPGSSQLTHWNLRLLAADPGEIVSEAPGKAVALLII